MNLKNLEALIAVNQHGTFKQAAQALYFDSPGEEYVTPESIQYRIRQLEEELGVSLYRKRQGSSRVTLTREGKLFLQEALDVYERMQEWRGMFLEKPSGNLTFAATQAVIINRLHDTIMEYYKRFPRVRIHAINADAAQMETLVATGKVDFAITTRPPAEPELDYLFWKRSSLVLVTPVGHPLTKLEKPRLTDIAQYPMITLDRDLRSDREMIDEAFRREGVVNREIALQASDSVTILSYVEAGMGVTIISETNLIRTTRKVVSKKIASKIGESEVGLLLREDQYLPSRVRDFLILLDKSFGRVLKERDQRIEKLREDRRNLTKTRRVDRDSKAPPLED
ncbi:MAG: LysR family transcriptional regulator [Candidatus Sumerlaeota bacterium]